MARKSGLWRTFVVLLGTAVAFLAGYAGFILVPRFLEGVSTIDILLVLSLGFAGLFVSQRIASSFVSPYNAAEVSVTGPITRSGSGAGLVPTPGFSADRIVDQIEAADADGNVEGLVVRLNTPGGEVVPSDDIRCAVEKFDGPKIAYATDVCASGGYWIASACDEVHARETSLVGSIGVLGSRVNAEGLADKLGLEYERFVAGRYKDAGNPLKETDDEESEYLQGFIDGLYDEFVSKVAEGRDMSEEEVRDTEARVYLGKEGIDVGLVDEVGTRDDMEERLEEMLEAEPEIHEFAPSRSFREQLGAGARSLAYSLGAGVGDSVREAEYDDYDFKLR